MATAVKRKLSGSSDGKAIKTTSTESSGAVTIHTSVAGTTDGTYDEIWLWAYNAHATDDVVLTIEFGGTTDPDNTIKTTIPFQSGLVPILPGLILQNEAVVKAFASTINVVTLIGFVNRITD